MKHVGRLAEAAGRPSHGHAHHMSFLHYSCSVRGRKSHRLSHHSTSQIAAPLGPHLPFGVWLHLVNLWPWTSLLLIFTTYQVGLHFLQLTGSHAIGIAAFSACMAVRTGLASSSCLLGAGTCQHWHLAPSVVWCWSPVVARMERDKADFEPVQLAKEIGGKVEVLNADCDEDQDQQNHTGTGQESTGGAIGVRGERLHLILKKAAGKECRTNHILWK